MLNLMHFSYLTWCTIVYMNENTLGEYLRRVLFEKRLSRRRAAEVTGISAGTIQDIITGKRIPSAATIAILADKLEADRDTMLSLAKYREEQTVSPAIAEASMLLSGLPEEEQEILAAMIRVYVDKRRQTNP